MKSLDNVFAKEFKDMMNGRRSMSGAFNIVDIPIPNIPTLTTNFGKGEICIIKGINEPFFEKLNEQQVQLVTNSVLMKRQVLSDGSFRVDGNGDFVYTQVAIKQGFIAISSTKSIGLKRKIEVNGVEKTHTPTDGYRYVDYFDLNGERRYVYIVPKNNVYPLELCALIVTPNIHRNFYKGCRLALQNGNYVYLYIIPFNAGKEPRGYRIIGAKASTNFDLEVKKLLEYWMNLGVIFDLNLTSLDNQVGGETNVGIMDLIGTLGVEDYVKINNSLS